MAAPRPTCLSALLIVSIGVLLRGPIGVSGGNPDAKRLYDDLLSNYNKLVRPVVNVSEAVTVRLKLKLSQLIDVVSQGGENMIYFWAFELRSGRASFFSRFSRAEWTARVELFFPTPPPVLSFSPL